MGYPSSNKLEGIIRNQIESVSKFLQERHPNSFKVFNLCSESDYKFAHFNNMIEWIPIDDHNPPRFEQILEFCSSVHTWLSEQSDHVAAIHCKAGKGRTGTMISCYLIFAKQVVNPFDAMIEFGNKRCSDSKVSSCVCVGVCGCMYVL